MFQAILPLKTIIFSKGSESIEKFLFQLTLTPLKIWLLLVCISSANASSLCGDQACDITLTFAEGGVIADVHGFVLIFGENASLSLGVNGYIDPGQVNQAVRIANHLVFNRLAKGDRLQFGLVSKMVFGTGGQLSLGWGGNILYYADSKPLVQGASDVAILATGDLYLGEISTESGNIQVTADTYEVTDDEVKSNSLTVASSAIRIRANGAAAITLTAQHVFSGKMTAGGSTDIIADVVKRELLPPQSKMLADQPEVSKTHNGITAGLDDSENHHSIVAFEFKQKTVDNDTHHDTSSYSNLVMRIILYVIIFGIAVFIAARWYKTKN